MEPLPIDIFHHFRIRGNEAGRHAGVLTESFRHKGLRPLFEDDDGSKLPQEMLARIRLILSTLHASEEIEGGTCRPFAYIHLKGI